MAINHLESIKMRVYVLLLTCLFFSLLGKPQQPRMMYEDTSRRGVPFSKDPHVVNFQGRYLMYYTLPPRLDVSGSGANIGIASSKDLVNWSKVGEITPEKNAVYEKNGLCAPGALVRDGKIHLFYQTYGNGKNDAICHAVSTDGIHFDRDPSNPVFHPTGDWNCGRAIDAEVCEFNGKYFLYFATRDKDLGLSFINNQVDIGVRVEVPAQVFKHITDEVYEAKLVYRTQRYNDLVRTFCMNPNGYVVAENTDGIVTVNGHSYRDPKLHSNNTNFALLVSNTFTEPFTEPHQYGKRIASFSNMLGGGVLLQRFGDLINGRRTNERRLKKSFTKPTLNATPGDLSLVLPKRQLDDIIEMIYALDKIAPGMANADTLLYGVEVKFYSARLELDGKLETKIHNLFACGDGAGITRGLSQASASGVHVARQIGERAGSGK